MNTNDLLLLNFMFSVVLALVMYRQYVVSGFRRERETEQIHQEIRNTANSMMERIDKVEDRIDRDMVEIYRDLDHTMQALPKKKTTGLNSRIPL